MTDYFYFLFQPSVRLRRVNTQTFGVLRDLIRDLAHRLPGILVQTIIAIEEDNGNRQLTTAAFRRRNGPFRDWVVFLHKVAFRDRVAFYIALEPPREESHSERTFAM